MEIIGGMIAGLVTMALLAGVGLAALVALAVMGVLYFLTNMEFKKVFLVSAGVGLLAPFAMGLMIAGALEDGSIQRELRDEVGPYIELPEDVGDNWREALPRLQELSRERDRGEVSDEETERRLEEILSEVGDISINIDVNGDGVTIQSDDNGVALELPEPVAVERESDGDGAP